MNQETQAILVNLFLRHLEAEEGRAATTVDAYRRDLSLWLKSAGGQVDKVRDVKVAHVRQWLATMAAKGHSPRSLKRRLQALRSWFGWLMATNRVASSPAADVQAPQTSKPLPVFIRQQETLSMIGQAQELSPAKDVLRRRRDALIVDMLYTTGLRCSELAALRDCDVDTARGTLRAMGKRRKERLIPFGPELASAVDAYRQERNSVWGPPAPHDPLLLNAHGDAMHRRAIYQAVHDIMSLAGVHAQKLSPHVLRHSCATDLLRAGADLNSVSALLGHASLAATQIYTHITDREMKENYQAAHPRSRR